MGRLTATQIRNLREPGRYNDGDGLFLELAGPNKGNWQLRATINGRRRDIGLGSLSLVSLKDAREALAEDVLPRYLRWLQNQLEAHGGEFFAEACVPQHENALRFICFLILQKGPAYLSQSCLINASF